MNLQGAVTVHDLLIDAPQAKDHGPRRVQGVDLGDALLTQLFLQPMGMPMDLAKTELDLGDFGQIGKDPADKTHLLPFILKLAKDAPQFIPLDMPPMADPDQIKICQVSDI